MKVLMFSIDGSILSGGEAATRMKRYGGLVDELHILVVARGAWPAEKIQLAENIWAYPVRFRWTSGCFFEVCRRAREIIGRHAKDWIITSQDAFTHIAAFQVRSKTDVPVEVQIHTDFMSPYFRTESVKNYIRYVLYAYAARNADTVRVVSPRLAESLTARGVTADRVTTLPIFVDIKKIADHVPSVDIRERYARGGQKPFVFLMASRLTKEKNISLAIRAFAEVIRQYPANKIFLVIVGDGPELEHLTSHISHLGLMENIFIEPAVPFKVLTSYYKTANIFLLTSKYEGYGRTLVEATAAKLPVITTDVGVARDIFVNGVTGCIVPAGDEGALAEALLVAVRDYPRFKSYGEKAGAMLLDSTPSEGGYLRAMQNAWRKCLASGKRVY